MSNGLYLPNGDFMSFSDHAASLSTEFATRVAAGADISGMLGWLPDPDPILRERSEPANVLDDLTADDQVCMAIQSRKLRVLNQQDYDFTAGQEPGHDADHAAESLCKALSKDLESIDLRNVFSAILDTPFYGYTVLELLWRPSGGRYRLADIIAKPRHWFAFNADNRLVFRGENFAIAEPLPRSKFVLVQHFPTFENPYGLRLLSRCLWPVAFKRGGIDFLTRFVEKYGMPWVVGTAGPKMDRDQRVRMAHELAAMVQDAVAVLQAGSKIDLVSSKGQAGDLHEKYLQRWDKAISKVLMGQTLTAEMDGNGSRAASETHYSVSQDISDADTWLVVSAMNNIACTYRDVNAGPSIMAPVFGYNEPEDYSERAELDTKMAGLGVKFRPSHFTRRYNMDPGEFYVDHGAGLSHVDAEFAEHDSKKKVIQNENLELGVAGQLAIDDLLLSVAPDRFRGFQAQLNVAVAAAQSFTEAEAAALDLLEHHRDETLTESLYQYMLAAQLSGMYAVLTEEAEIADYAEPSGPVNPLSTKQAREYWKSKVPMTDSEFKKLAAEVRVNAFAVSGLADLEQVKTLHGSIGQAIENGTPFKQWQKQHSDLWEEKGWTGKKAWRAETIYYTNTQMAYQIGRYKQLKRSARTRPYWRYFTMQDGKERPAHRAMHGRVYRHDHPIWDTWYPLNGYRCRCGVQSLSARQVAARGYTVSDEMPGTTMMVDADGMETFVTPIPDKGWARNPAADHYKPNLGEYPADFRQSFLQRLLRHSPDGLRGVAEHNMTKLRKHLHPNDLDAMQDLLAVDALAGGAGYDAWIQKIVDSNFRAAGEVHAMGKIPRDVLEKLENQFGVKPHLASVVTEDSQIVHALRTAKVDRDQALTLNEMKSVPEKMQEAKWFRENESGVLICAWPDGKGRWCKLVVQADYKLKKVNTPVNTVRTAGRVYETDLFDPRKYNPLN